MKRILLFTFVLLFHFAHAQWTSDTDLNTLAADSKADDIKAVTTSNGQTLIVFWKPVSAPINYELRMQLLDEDGVPQLEEDGKLLSNQTSMSTYIQTWTLKIDDNDQVYIGFTGTANSNAYVFKTNTSGNNLWGDSGIEVGSGNAITTLPLTDGNTIVSWQQTGGAKIQMLDEDGNTLWDSPMNISENFSNTVPAELFELSDGDIIAVFHSVSYGINSTLYAQRFDNDGNPQWDEEVQLSNNATQMNKTYSYVQIEDVVYIGYSASVGMRFDAYLQRINSDGDLPWGINGVDFDTNQTNYEMETKIAHTPLTKHIWAISTYTDTGQSQKGEYVQKFHSNTGDRLLTDNAQEVFPIGSQKTHQGDLQLLNDNPVFLYSSETNAAGMIYELEIAELNSNGEFIDENSPTPIATYYAEKNRINLTKEYNGQLVAVFKEQKGNDDQPVVYAQNYKPSNENNPCEAPEEVEIEEVTNSTAVVTWEPGMDPEETNGWEVIFGPEGFDPDGDEGTSIFVEDTPFVELENLDENITYDVYVRTICNEEENSEWVGPITFTTEEGEEPIEDCETPLDIETGEITESSVEVLWVSAGNESSWMVIYGEAGFTEDFTEIIVTEPNYTIEGLDADTDYEVYVVSICGDDLFSDPTDRLTFTTEPMSVNIEIFNHFSYYPNPAQEVLTLKAATQIDKVEVFNFLGQSVMILTPNAMETQLNTEQLQSGAYLMKVSMEGFTKTFRVMKK